MKVFSYKQAKEEIGAICEAARAGSFDSRDKFMELLDRNAHIAAQGYNPHGKIFFWNEASAHLYGHSEAAAVNQDIFDLILPQEMQTFAREMIRYTMKTGNTPAASACDLLHRTGERVTVYSGHLVFQWSNGSPEFYCIDLPLQTEG